MSSCFFSIGYNLVRLIQVFIPPKEEKRHPIRTTTQARAVRTGPDRSALLLLLGNPEGTIAASVMIAMFASLLRKCDMCDFFYHWLVIAQLPAKPGYSCVAALYYAQKMSAPEG